MKIAHYNTYASGGAFVLMKRLHHSLRNLGHESHIRFRYGNYLSQVAQQVEYCSNWSDRQRERFQHRCENLMLRRQAPSYYNRVTLHKATPLPVADQSVDIIHLHWINQWLDLPSFLSDIPKRTPIVWTIHDMSPLAGGCYTDFGCSQFSKGCHCCPLLRTPFDRILAKNELYRRFKAIEGRRIIAVGNSQDTTHLIRKSVLFRNIAEVETIHPGIDPKEFVRHDKAEARRLLGIDPDRFLLGFGAAVLTDENKGFGRFLSIAGKLATRFSGMDALVFGEGISGAECSNVTVHCLGKISSPKLLSLVYSAMDVFVVASRMETFGQVATEAQACGTPVWAFDTGGLGDAIQDGVTGRLIPFADVEAMADSIHLEAAAGNLALMGDRGFRWARNNFDIANISSKYLNLYRRAIGI